MLTRISNVYVFDDQVVNNEDYVPPTKSLRDLKMSGVDIHVPADIMSKENPVRGARRNGVTPTVISQITNKFIVGCGGDPSTIYSSYSYANNFFFKRKPSSTSGCIKTS